ncbi:hypothetical protein [Burkholderia gladioli]|uniref:hypothetical protein n=1 Tax=Burkholderia gladioli TaxID=28095 RepID=UPI001FC861C9|nr:hypothetical protein [Burkholderia gladioli]
MSVQITFIEAILVDSDHSRASSVHGDDAATNHGCLRLRPSEGIEGIGEATTIGGLSYGEESPEGIKLTIDTYLAPALVGLDASNINAAMPSSTRSRVVTGSPSQALNSVARRTG